MRDLVVIGGSIHGVRTVCRLLDQVPSPFDAPILAALHTGKDREGDERNLLSACTARPVSYASDGDGIEAGRIYLAPPHGQLIVASAGRLHVESNSAADPAHQADRLFESAAHKYGPRVVGVLLAGGEGDGVRGLRAINAAGGIGLLEVPNADDAFPAVSTSTGNCGTASYCLALQDIAELLGRLIDGTEKVATSAQGTVQPSS